jgi:L-lactate utilization protein LutC
MPGISEQEFLARVRAGRERPVVHWTHDHDVGEPKPPEIADPVAYYVERAQKVFLRPSRVPSMSAAADAVVAILKERGVKKLVRWADPIVDQLGVDERLKAAGIMVTRWADLSPKSSEFRVPGSESSQPETRNSKPETDAARTAAFEADAGLGSADLLVAETGSVLLGASAVRGRGVSLCPPAYIAVVPAQRVVRHLSEALAFIGGRLKETQRGQYVFLSGPSRTADIEMNLVTGVHGPEFVYIVIVG